MRAQWQRMVLVVGMWGGTALGQPLGTEVYGVLDLGITSLDHARPFDPALGTVPMTNRYATDRVTGLTSGNLQTSRLGIRGEEALGNGLTVPFVLESHINANNGTLAAGAQTTGAHAGTTQAADSSCSGQLFCREAWVGIRGVAGTLGLGRQYAFTYDMIAAYDPFRASTVLDGAGSAQQGGGNPRDVRVDNSLKYTARLQDFRAGLEYGWGGIAGDPSADAFEGFNLGYESGPFGIQGVWQRKRDAQIWSATSPVANTVYDTNTQTLLLALRYQWGYLTLHGGYERTQFTAGSNALCSAAGNVACGVSAHYDGKVTEQTYGGLTYAVSSRWTLVGACYDLHQSAFQTGAGTQADGHQRDFSAMADYRLSVRADVYTAMRQTWLSGGNAYNYANTGFTLLTVGTRYVF